MAITTTQNKAIESLAAARAQLTHIRNHGGTEIGPKTIRAIDRLIPAVYKIMEELSAMDVAK